MDTVIVWFGVIVPLWVPEIEGYGFEGVPVSKISDGDEKVIVSFAVLHNYKYRCFPME